MRRFLERRRDDGVQADRNGDEPDHALQGTIGPGQPEQRDIAEARARASDSEIALPSKMAAPANTNSVGVCPPPRSSHA